jgi:NADPH:quinone reductase-like Zn-dependent oxidoreductase
MTIALKDDVPFPAPRDPNVPIAPTDVLIKVKSAAINPVDYKLPRLVAGAVVGIDVSGIVERVGSDVADLKIGDAVFGRCPVIGGKGGSLAEYALVPMDEIAIKPEWLNFDQAAALGVAYLTGLQSLRAGNVAGDSSVLIIGASGGCGIAGVQLARAMGVSRIVGICSGKNFDFVRETSGMDLELIDYTNQDSMDKFKADNVVMFDCIYDTATGSGNGEDYVASMMPLLRGSTGTYVQINGSPTTMARHAIGRMKAQRKVVFVSEKGRKDLEEIVSLLKIFVARPHLDVKAFDENGVKGAFEQLRGRRTKGKIVFNIS